MRYIHLKQRAFTLVEILVVLAIVLLLAAILFPVFARVRDGARTTTCASNLRQIGAALLLYAGDNNQRLPLIFHDKGLTWVDSIYPYVKSTRVFVCPSAQHGDYVPGGSPGSPIIMEDSTTQFGDNGSYDIVTPFIQAETTPLDTGFVHTYTVQPFGLSLTRYRLPTSTILALDGGDTTYYFHNNYAAVNPGVDPISSVADLNDGGIVACHKDGVNVLFADGHVKWQSLQNLTSTPMWRTDGREPQLTATPPAPH